MIDPLPVWIVAISFGLMLLLAAIHKLSDIHRFQAVLADYRVLPVAVAPVAAIILPAIEAGLGLAWLFTPAASLPAVATTALLFLYTLGIVVNLLRGRIHISCGCGFGNAAGTGDSLSWGLVLRNVVLIGAAAVALVPVTARDMGWLDYISMVGALLAIVLLFAATNQLVRNRAAIGLWRDRVHGND